MPTRGLINPELLTDIADAIRAKNGTSARMTPAQMAASVGSLVVTPEGIVTATGQMTTEQAAQTRENIGVVIDTTLSVEGDAADAKATGKALEFTNSYIISQEEVTLPSVIKGKFQVTADSNNKIISGTQNVAQLLGIKEGTFEIDGLTITVSGCTVSVSGTTTEAFNYSLADGAKKTATELTAMTLPIPVHFYTLSSKAISGSSPYPGLMVRSKLSGNAVVTQNNTAQFTMNPSTCGGLYIGFSNNTAYNFTYKIALLPFAATNGSEYREQDSDITVINDSDIYALNGYTWAVGTPEIYEIKSKLPKKPLCKYSTRTIDYTGMDACVDVYIPAKNGYVNYIFGHTVTPTPKAEGGSSVWRIVQIDAVNDALQTLFHITQLGETEMAIKIVGRDDFIGGYTHGDEWLKDDSLLFVLDGKPIDISEKTELTEFTTLQVFAVNDMYDPNDHTTKVGLHGMEWLFNADGLYLGQTVEYDTTLTLENSYMPMLCAMRGNDTASAIQVTDIYTDDGSYQKYDVGTGGFSGYPVSLKADVREANLFGQSSGVRTTVKILERPEGLKGAGVFLYNGVNTYNKIYSTICGYGNSASTQENVSAGTKWKVKSQITIDIG